MTDSIEEIKGMYKHFSQGTHPNRTHVPFLFLGEGNRFTLGGIHPIDRCMHWYIGMFVWNYRESTLSPDRDDFAREMLDLTPRRKSIAAALNEQLDRLRSESSNGPPTGIGPSYKPPSK